MTIIRNSFHTEQIEYRGYMIEVDVGYIDDESGDNCASQASIYKNSVGAGLELKTFTARTDDTQRNVENVCDRAKSYIDTWKSAVDDVKGQMQDGIQSVFAEPAIVNVTASDE